METLRKVLFVNSISSGVTGLGLVSFATALAELFGTLPIAVSETGIFLIGFSIFVFIEARRTTLKPGRISAIITLDILWVVLSAIIIVFQLFNLTFIGYTAIGVIAIWVAGMAFLQSNGKKAITRATA